PLGVAPRVGQLIDRAVFVGQERSVGSENSVLRGECRQFVDQLLVFAAQVQFVDNLADSPHRPEFFHERVGLIRTVVYQFGWEVQRLFLVADFPRDRYLGVTRLFVTANNDQLLAGKQVVHFGWINAINRLAFL